MEKKEPVKINLTTALLIIAIIVIIGMEIIIINLYDKKENNQTVLDNKNSSLDANEIENRNIVVDENKTTNDVKQDEQKNNSKETSENKQEKGIEVVPFDTKFYEIKDVALDYRECSKLKNYKDFEYDLDGDSKKDKISVIVNNEGNKKYFGEDNEEANYAILLNDKVFEYIYSYAAEIYIVDLNKEDNHIEVITWNDAPSDDPHFIVYSKVKNKMEKFEKFNLSIRFLTNNKGKFIVDDDDTTGIVPYVYDSYYEIKNSKIEQKEIDISKLSNTDFKIDESAKNEILVTDKISNIKKFHTYYFEKEMKYEEALKKADITKIEKNRKFKIIGFEYDGYEYDCVKLQYEDGKVEYTVRLRLAG